MNAPEFRSPSPAVSPAIYGSSEYFSTLINDIDSAKNGDRVALSTMGLAPQEQPVADTLTALAGAAQRGADVKLLVDAYAFLVDARTSTVGPMFVPFKFHHPTFANRAAVLKGLQAEGVNVTVTNKPSRYLTNPCAGRSHIKGAVVNNRTYLGGQNLEDTHRIDAMLGFDDVHMADWFYGIHTEISRTGNARAAVGSDHSVEIHEDAQALIDAGKPNESVIFDKALGMIDETNGEDWLVMSLQYFPRPRLLKRLLAAQERGVDIHLLYNSPTSKSLISSLPERLAAIREAGIMTDVLLRHVLGSKATLHAKIIATSKEAMVSSHNYDQRGVKFGTAEVGYAKRNPVFSAAVGNYILESCDIDHVVNVPTSRIAA